MRYAVAAVAVALLAATASVRAETFAGTEYVSGKSGQAKKIKGTLVVEAAEVRFEDKNGVPVFTIPVAEITRATDSREHDEGSFGRKMALGIFASKTEEFLTIHTAGAASAEAVVFKCKKKTAPGIAAKINFHASKAPQAAASQP